jgi:hypothetical protein
VTVRRRSDRGRTVGAILALTAAITAALILVFSGALSTPHPPSPTTTTVTATTVAQTIGRPRVDVTPGVVLTTSADDVCMPGWAAKHRHGLTTTQKAAVLKAYGYSATQKVAEYDHLVSLELGGGNGVKNIWPMVSDPDQARKDRLENRLHAQVCAGKLTLTKAQAEIRQYWLHW